MPDFAMSIANLPSSMTLGRFVRVTLHNFRLLINAYSGSTVAPFMPEASTNDTRTNDTSTNDTSTNDTVESGLNVNGAAATVEESNAEPLAFAAQSTVAQHGADNTNNADHAHIQPALNLATENDAIVLAAKSENGELLVCTGDAALSITSVLESLLFVADAPVEVAQLARVLNTPVEVVEGHLRRLAAEYHAQGRGLRVAERNGRFQMVTAPAAAALIETFLNLDMTTKLSAPALETLAVVAYRQPVTRAQVEAVRGVDCSGILRSLLQRGLVEEVDRLDAPGRPMRYGVTDLFMQHFGLTGLHELPPLAGGEAEQLDGALEREV
jgi:segregation and condensation protein B